MFRTLLPKSYMSVIGIKSENMQDKNTSGSYTLTDLYTQVLIQVIGIDDWQGKNHTNSANISPFFYPNSFMHLLIFSVVRISHDSKCILF